LSIFRKTSIWNYICQFCGLFLIGLFVFVGYKDNEATIGETLFGIIFGAIILAVSTISLFFNYKAYLSIQDGQIKANTIGLEKSIANFQMWILH